MLAFILIFYGLLTPEVKVAIFNDMHTCEIVGEGILISIQSKVQDSGKHAHFSCHQLELK